MCRGDNSIQGTGNGPKGFEPHREKAPGAALRQQGPACDGVQIAGRSEMGHYSLYCLGAVIPVVPRCAFGLSRKVGAWVS